MIPKEMIAGSSDDEETKPKTQSKKVFFHSQLALEKAYQPILKKLYALCFCCVRVYVCVCVCVRVRVRVRACVCVYSGVVYIVTYCRAEELKSDDVVFIDWQPKIDSWATCDPKCVLGNHMVTMVYNSMITMVYSV